MTTDSRQLLIIGASVRAAARSALRGLRSVWGADLFADEDLRAIATAEHVERYPVGFLPALRHAPQAPWLYTGALENYPRLIARMAQLRPLLGNGAEVLRQVRDSFLLAEVLPQAGIPFPETCREMPTSEPDQWLLKPIRSAAGRGIMFLHSATLQVKNQELKQRRCMAQRFIPGQPCSAVYVAAGGDAVFLGLTRQLIGWPAGGFTYCGSLGPVPLSAGQSSALLHIGRTLADRFSLTGLFGVDLVESRSGNSSPPEYVVIEVNPRYTASVEVLERARLVDSIRWHLAACTQGVLPIQSQVDAFPNEGWSGKAILFARHAAIFHSEVDLYVQLENRKSIQPRIADIPAAGTKIEPGQPVVTLFAQAGTEQATLQVLRAKLQEFESVLYQSPP